MADLGNKLATSHCDDQFNAMYFRYNINLNECINCFKKTIKSLSNILLSYLLENCCKFLSSTQGINKHALIVLPLCRVLTYHICPIRIVHLGSILSWIWYRTPKLGQDWSLAFFREQNKRKIAAPIFLPKFEKSNILGAFDITIEKRE